MKKLQFIGDANMMTDAHTVGDSQLSGVRKTGDGYLVGRVRCARTGIQHYTGEQLGRDDLDVVALYRSPDEVFKVESLATYVGRPMTNDHPTANDGTPIDVTSKNWRQYARGDIGEDVLRDGEYVNIPITMMDSGMIQDYEAGKKELSMGYSHMVEFVDGVAPCGTAYQAVSRDLKMNHLALVDRGRAGHECRVGDNADSVPWGLSPLTIDDEETKVPDKQRTVIVDGFSVETTEQGAQAIDKIQADKASLETQVSDNQKAHDKALASKDAELKTANDKIDELEGKQLDQKAIDALVEKRGALLSKAELIAADEDFAGLSDDDVRKKAVTATMGADSIEGKTVDYITARFDIAAEQAQKAADADNTDGFKKSVVDSKGKNQNVQDNGQADYEAGLESDWQNTGEK